MFTTSLAGDQAGSWHDMTFGSASNVMLRCKSWSPGADWVPELPVAWLDQSAMPCLGLPLFSARAKTPPPLPTLFLQALNNGFGMEKEREREDGVRGREQDKTLQDSGLYRH